MYQRTNEQAQVLRSANKQKCTYIDSDHLCYIYLASYTMIGDQWTRQNINPFYIGKFKVKDTISTYK